MSSPGLVGDALREQGWRVDEITVVPASSHHEPNVAMSFPDSADYDLLVPVGAPWSAYDDQRIGRWLAPELRWLADAVARGGAVLGICFGAQALARALGGGVRRAETPEIGWVPVDSDVPEVVPAGPWFQWHFDRFAPPPGAVEIARNSAASQAYRIGRCLGVQFHPEATAEGIEVWVDNGGAAHARALGIEPADLLAQARLLAAEARERARALVSGYLTTIHCCGQNV
ncbi:type 1 glutamine amidotransferase [Kutzneria sp. CA-103260]|uniref:type 1 glutamine amidotransferase n=1 Tax=Kutzneria sp. CA-103260 TaxID=2802641 RepID=UPI001BAC6101|nr:aminotransferase [Kutzneria sp. CA-103260]